MCAGMMDAVDFLFPRSAWEYIPDTSKLPLEQEWAVHPTDELLHRLRDLAGPEQIDIVY